MAYSSPYNYGRDALPDGQTDDQSDPSGAPTLRGPAPYQPSSQPGSPTQSPRPTIPNTAHADPVASPRTFAQMQAEGYARPPMPVPQTAPGAPGYQPNPSPAQYQAQGQAPSQAPQPSAQMVGNGYGGSAQAREAFFNQNGGANWQDWNNYALDNGLQTGSQKPYNPPAGLDISTDQSPYGKYQRDAQSRGAQLGMAPNAEDRAAFNAAQPYYGSPGGWNGTGQMNGTPDPSDPVTNPNRYMIDGEVLTPDGGYAPSPFQQQRTIGDLTTPYRNPDANPGAMVASEASLAALKEAVAQNPPGTPFAGGVASGATSAPPTPNVPASVPPATPGPTSAISPSQAGSGIGTPSSGIGNGLPGSVGEPNVRSASGPTSAGPAAPSSPPSSASAPSDILSLLVNGANGSGAGSAVQDATQRKTLDLLNNPSPYGQQNVKDLYSWEAGNIDDQYALEQQKLDEEMARRGLGVSTNKAGRLNDLNIGKRSAKATLANDLDTNYAQTLGNYQTGAVNAGNAVGTTAQNNRQNWLTQLMGYGQQGFNNDLATNAVNQNAANSYQNFILQLLGMGYGGAT